MATFNWTALNNNAVIAFNPAVDVFNFNDATISAADIGISSNVSPTDNINFTFGGKTITLQVDPLALTTTNVTFADGSMLIIGDNTTGILNDDAANTLVGGAGDDQLIGLGGADSMVGNGGNDLFMMFPGNGGLMGNDTINGGAGTDSIRYINDASFGASVNLATGIATGGGDEAGDGTLSLTSIEQAYGTQLADTLTGGSGNELFSGQAGSDVITGGAGSDTLDYLNSPARVIVNMTGSAITVGTDTVQGGTALDGWGPAATNTDTISQMENVLGSAFNDFIIGNNAVNRLEGRDGDDILVGGGSNLATGDSANDTLLGGAGDDQLRQTRGADFLDGGSGSDRLVFTNNTGVTTTGVIYGGAVGVNVNLAAHTSDYDTSDALNPLGTLVSIEAVTGTAGNDNFVGGDLTHAPDVLGNATTESFRPLGGNDTITGATGNGFGTRVDYSTNTNAQAVSVNLGTGIASDGQGGTDALVRVDQAFGGEGGDTLLGGGQGRSANGSFFEFFRGNGGDDTINGAGTDTVVGAAGSDRANYGNSPSAVIVNLGATPFVVGLDTVPGGTARDGFGFTDTLLNIDQVEGSNFNDTLVGGGSNHRLIGGAGNDSLVGGTSGVEASYQNATGAVNVSLAIAGAQAVGADQGSDTLTNIADLRGSDFNDTLTGNAADNRIAGDSGADTIDGGGGIDFASYAGVPLANGGINALIENGAGSVNDGFGFTDTLTNIEGLTGTHSGDTLTGGLGNQWFIGRGGSDVINGGGGNDWVSYIGDPAGVTANLGTGSATDGWGGVWGFGGTDTLTLIENVEGSNFNDTLTGNAGANTLNGGAGNDTLNGGAGNDTMVGGAGNDTYVRNATGDVVTEGANAGTDTVQSAVTYTLGANLEKLTLTGSAAINGTGNGLANTITGNSGNNVLNGGAGNDTLIGGAGNDTYVRNATGDVVTEGANAGTDTVQSAVTYTLGANLENLTLTGAGLINGTGNTLNNVLTGNTANNTLNGGTGNDTLNGGAGNDTLIGGNGNDTLAWDPLDGSLQGGAGSDTLRVDGAGKVVNLTTVPDTRITNVEVVNLTGSGANTLTVGLADVLAISSSTDTLRVDGNAGDTVHRGAGWTTGADQMIGANTYHSYTQGLATLLVDTDISSVV